jgi:APA family basic amino acid/polyamine antiporter
LITLARKLRVVDYFTLGWGTMVGVGWLVVMDDWLLRGGVLGAVLGFAIGGALLLPVGYVYARLVKAIPDASGEVAYTAKVFPQSISYATGWMMVLSYFIVCPWEAVAVGKIAAYIFPALDSVEVYRIAERPVYLPHLLIGLGLTGLITLLNYRGVRLSATFQNWTTFGTLALFVVSVLLVLQIVLYFMTGYESVGKAAEEATAELPEHGFLTAIWMAIVVGALFYTVIIAAVAYVAPWKNLAGEKFMTAVAFEHAVGARWIVSVILAAALLSLFKCFNGNFVAASRLLFGIGRRGLIPGRIGHIHPRNQTPSFAVLLVGLATAACMFLGDAILVPVTEVGSAAAAVGILAACASYYRIVNDIRQRCIAVVGGAVGLTMILMKVLPGVPGHFSRYEWLALGVWVALGAVLGRWPKS